MNFVFGRPLTLSIASPETAFVVIHSGLPLTVASGAGPVTCTKNSYSLWPVDSTPAVSVMVIVTRYEPDTCGRSCVTLVLVSPLYVYVSVFMSAAAVDAVYVSDPSAAFFTVCTTTLAIPSSSFTLITSWPPVVNTFFLTSASFSTS